MALTVPPPAYPTPIIFTPPPTSWVQITLSTGLVLKVALVFAAVVFINRYVPVIKYFKNMAISVWSYIQNLMTDRAAHAKIRAQKVELDRLSEEIRLLGQLKAASEGSHQSAKRAVSVAVSEQQRIAAQRDDQVLSKTDLERQLAELTTRLQQLQIEHNGLKQDQLRKLQAADEHGMDPMELDAQHGPLALAIENLGCEPSQGELADIIAQASASKGVFITSLERALGNPNVPGVSKVAIRGILRLVKEERALVKAVHTIAQRAHIV